MSDARHLPEHEIHQKHKKEHVSRHKEIRHHRKHKEISDKKDISRRHHRDRHIKKDRHQSHRRLSQRHTRKGTLVSLRRLTSEMMPGKRGDWLEHAKEGQLRSTGKASWYGKDFHGGPTASGVKYDMYTFTAAHRTLPMGTVVKVTRQDNDKSVMVCVTDRGPYVQGRIIDLSYAAATQLDLRTKGVGDVRLEVVSDERGKPLRSSQAFYVQYTAAKGKKMAGPYREFADAAAMQEALRQAHPEATVVLDRVK